VVKIAPSTVSISALAIVSDSCMLPASRYREAGNLYPIFG
jgi:hypothetical protein